MMLLFYFEKGKNYDLDLFDFSWFIWSFLGNDDEA